MNQKQIQHLDLLLNQVRTNTIDLLAKEPTKGQLIMTGLCKSKKLLNGHICEKDIVDIGAIGMTLVLQKEED